MRLYRSEDKMEHLKREQIYKNELPGRVVQNAVGKNSALASEKMTVSYCRYSAKSGQMEPHRHAEESVVVLDCRDAYVQYGSAKDCLEHKEGLSCGDLLHFADMEWHVFGYEEGGFLDALCIYGQVTGIRPEEKGQL